MEKRAEVAVAAWQDGMTMLGQELDDWSVEESGSAIAVTSSSLFATLNLVADLTERPDVTAMARLAAGVRARGVPWSIQVRGEPSPAVTGLAEQNDLRTRTSTLLMLGRRADLSVQRIDVPGVTVTSVGSSGWRAYASALERGFETGRGLWGSLVRGQLLDTTGVQAYIAASDGQDVGTALGIRRGPGVGIYNVSVVPGARGRGIGRLLTGQAVSDGLNNGADLAYLVSSPAGASLYASMGFSAVATINTFS